MFPLAVAFAVAFALSLGLTHRTRSWAKSAGFVDMPDGHRRLHAAPVPRVGGIAVFTTSMVVMGGMLLLIGGDQLLAEVGGRQLYVLLAGGALIFALGLWDDVKELSARTKLLVEVAIALGVFAMGIRISGFGLSAGLHVDMAWWVSMGLTVLWIVGITNAFNLIDGGDGIAAGAALFASLAIAAVSLAGGSTFGALLALTLAGATLGFMFFNFPPASVFLGDCGSLFLGFSLATLGVITTQKASTALAIAIPAVAFGFPILDTLLAMVRRFLRREPVSRADRGHIHHRLSDLGHSPRTVVLILYTVCGGLALLSLLLTEPAGSMAGIVFVVGGAVLFILIQRLHIPELVELQRIVDRGLHQRHVIANNTRIRRAVSHLETADEPGSVLQTLSDAFDSKDFDRVELWLAADVGQAIENSAGVDIVDNGYRWVGPLSKDESPYGTWKLQLPFDGMRGRTQGMLTLSLCKSGPHLLTDLRLIALELQPAFLRALKRLQEERAQKEPAEKEAPVDMIQVV